MSPEDSNFFLRPAHTSVLRSVNITDVLRYRGEDIDERFLRTDGTNQMTGNLNLGGNRITNVADPVGDNDVATRGFVEAEINNIEVLRVQISDLLSNVNTYEDTACFRNSNAGIRHELSVSCPTGQQLLSCSGGPGDQFESSEGWWILSFYDTNTCTLIIHAPACVAGQPWTHQRIQAHCI